MNDVKRRLLQLCFAFGLLLTLAAGTLWIRGFWASDTIVIQRGSGMWLERVAVRVDRQGVTLSLFRLRPFRGTGPSAPAKWSWWRDSVNPLLDALTSPDPGAPWWMRLGFGFDLVTSKAMGKPIVARQLGVAAPWWFLIMVGVAIIALTRAPLLTTRRHLRRAAGLCEFCAYDRGGRGDCCSRSRRGYFRYGDIGSRIGCRCAGTTRRMVDPLGSTLKSPAANTSCSCGSELTPPVRPACLRVGSAFVTALAHRVEPDRPIATPSGAGWDSFGAETGSATASHTPLKRRPGSYCSLVSQPPASRLSLSATNNAAPRAVQTASAPPAATTSAARSTSGVRNAGRAWRGRGYSGGS